MANENLKNEILTNEQLDKVAGGHGGDRTLMAGWIAVYYGSNGERGKIIDTSDFNSPAIVSKFCSKVGIDYRQNSDGYDELKINGEWRNVWWMIEPVNKAEAFEFFDKKFGIN